MAMERLERLRETAHAAAEKAKGLSQETTERIAETSGTLKETAGRLAEASRAKYDEVLDSALTEINGIKPLLAQAGFLVETISCTATLPPDVSMGIAQYGEGKKSLEQLVDEGEGELSPLQSAVLQSLMRAHDMAAVPERLGYRATDYNLRLGLPPSLSVRFRPVRADI